MKKRSESSEAENQAKPAVDPLPPADRTVEGGATASVEPDPVSGGENLDPSRPAPDEAKDGARREGPNLADLEIAIAHGLPQQEAVAFALLEIHDRRLYRPDYRSFKDYLFQRWEFSRARGYQLLKFARLKRMSTMVGTSAPNNERQARTRDARGQARGGREDLVLRAMNYVADTFERLPDFQRRELIHYIRALVAELEAALNRGEPPAPPG
jgi:hypothetical protein